MNTNTFLPSFGNKPQHIIGRGGIISAFLEGLSMPIGHRQRSTIMIGQRGTGKTTLLLEFEDMAEKAGFIPARVTANEDMLNRIVEKIQKNGSRFVPQDKKKIKGVTAGAIGFSFGLTFTEDAKAQLSPNMKIELLCEELAKNNKGVLILVDEVLPDSPAIRELTTMYQELVGDNKNIALVMAGLPTSISSVLNDKILTFLNRAYKIHLEPIPYNEISLAYAEEFNKLEKTIAPDILDKAALATKGYPYLYQLIGYYILSYAKSKNVITAETIELAVISAKREMIDTIFIATLAPLSKQDRAFLQAMAMDDDESDISHIQKEMNVSANYIQRYRKRLIESGVIASATRGKLTFIVPYLREYLRGDF